MFSTLRYLTILSRMEQHVSFNVSDQALRPDLTWLEQIRSLFSFYMLCIYSSFALYFLFKIHNFCFRFLRELLHFTRTKHL